MPEAPPPGSSRDRQLSAAEMEELLAIIFHSLPADAREDAMRLFLGLVFALHRDYGIRPPDWCLQLMRPDQILELVDMLFAGIPAKRRPQARSRFLDVVAAAHDDYQVPRPAWLRLAFDQPDSENS